MSKERKPTFNYILNDIALLSLLTKCLYSEYPSEQDKYDLEYQVKLLLENETKLKKEKYKAREYIKEHTDKLKTIRVPKIDFDYKELLEILGDKENE